MALSRLAMRSMRSRSQMGMKALAGTTKRNIHLTSRAAAAKVSPAELTKILTDRITNFSDAKDVEEVGRVLNVGDGTTGFQFVCPG